MRATNITEGANRVQSRRRAPLYWPWVLIATTWAVALLATLTHQTYLIDHGFLLEQSRLPWPLTLAIFLAGWQVMTVAMMLLVLIAFLAVVIGGPLFGSIAKAAGISSGASEVVGLIRWPIGAAALLTAIALLYSFGPRKGRKHQRALRSIKRG